MQALYEGQQIKIGKTNFLITSANSTNEKSTSYKAQSLKKDGTFGKHSYLIMRNCDDGKMTAYAGKRYASAFQMLKDVIEVGEFEYRMETRN